MTSARTVPGPFGPYALIERLGFGGHGSAYLAADPERGLIPGTFVVKVLHDLESSVLLERFEHEAEILRYIDSPHVVRVLESGVIDGEPYLAMELAPGWRVSKCLDIIASSGQRPAVAETIEVFSGGLRGLIAIHEAKHPRSGEPLEVIHRDITPKNLMVDQKRVMRIIDFGLGRSAQRTFDTRTGMMLGTPGYMAPEVVLGRAVDHRADLYAFGVILWEWLTLRRYIPKGNLPEMLAASKAPSFTAPSKLVARALPKALDELLHTALQHEPSARFANAREMLAALESAVPPPEDETEVLATRIYVPTEYERAPASPTSAIEVPLASPAPASWMPKLAVLTALGLLGLGLGTLLRTEPSSPTAPASAPISAPRAAPGIRAIAEPPTESAPPLEAPAPLEPEPLPPRPAREKRERMPPRDRPPEPEEPRPAPRSVDSELAACRRLAERVKQVRPDLGPQVSRVLDQVAMDAAIGDPSVALARLDSARRRLERLLETTAPDPINRDMSDLPH